MKTNGLSGLVLIASLAAPSSAEAIAMSLNDVFSVNEPEYTLHRCIYNFYNVMDIKCDAVGNQKCFATKTYDFNGKIVDIKTINPAPRLILKAGHCFDDKLSLLLYSQPLVYKVTK